MARDLRPLLALLALLAAAGAVAQGLPDPTRPPPEFMRDADLSAAPVLQSIMISPTRRTAIINGQTVRQGEKYRDAEVLEIRPGEVILREGNRREVLKLHTALRDVDKAPPSAKDRAKGKQ